MNIKRIIIATLLISMLLPIIWVAISTMGKSKQILKTEDFILGAKVSNYDEKGELKSELVSREWQIGNNEKHSIFIEPKLKLVRKSSTWNITAKKGTAKHANLGSNVDIVDLEDNVEIIRLNAKQQRETTLQSQFISYKPKTEDVSSDKFVKLSTPGKEVTGTGMEGNFKTNQFHLKKNVKTSYKEYKS